jgi:hypothetical protein
MEPDAARNRAAGGGAEAQSTTLPGSPARRDARWHSRRSPGERRARKAGRLDWLGCSVAARSLQDVGRTIKQYLDGPTWNQDSLDWLGREYDRLAARTASFTGALKAGQRSRRAQALSAGSRTTFFRYQRSSPVEKIDRCVIFIAKAAWTLVVLGHTGPLDGLAASGGNCLPARVALRKGDLCHDG